MKRTFLELRVDENEKSDVIVKEYSLEEKIDFILNEYNLTIEQFKVIVGIVLAESKANSYEDAYSVANTLYNRTISKIWTSYIDTLYGFECGTSLYYQAICPGQFVVYESGIYKQYMNSSDLIGFNALIDMFYSKESIHNYLSFKAAGTNTEGKVQFVSGGNLYFNELKEDDVIKTESALYVKKIIRGEVILK